jgi:hypothetical protein
MLIVLLVEKFRSTFARTFLSAERAKFVQIFHPRGEAHDIFQKPYNPELDPLVSK